MSYYTDVKAFHEKFSLEYDGPPRMLNAEEQGFRWRFLNEELKEVKDALLDQDIAQVAGELADVIWIACGIAHRMGIDLDAHWNAIALANMQKTKAGPNGEGSKRGSPLDIIKPEGWAPADHEAILNSRRA